MFDPAFIFANLNIQDDSLAQKIAELVKPKLDLSAVENYISNKKLYPQSVPSTKLELNIDLHLLKEFLRLHPDAVYNGAKRTLVFDLSLINRFGDLKKITLLTLEAISTLDPITQILVRDDQNNLKLVGSLIKPKITPNIQKLDIKLGGKSLNLTLGKVFLIPIKMQNIEVNLGSELPFKVSGGDLGLIFDCKQNYE